MKLMKLMKVMNVMKLMKKGKKEKIESVEIKKPVFKFKNRLSLFNRKIINRDINGNLVINF